MSEAPSQALPRAAKGQLWGPTPTRSNTLLLCGGGTGQTSVFHAGWDKGTRERDLFGKGQEI